MKTVLTLIGYWKSQHEQKWPHPVSFIDLEWAKQEKEFVVQYLEKGLKMPYIFAGSSFCRFNGGIKHNGNLELTDGTYVWPEGLKHYVQFHNVKLPLEFINHCKTNTSFSSISEKDLLSGKVQIDYTWWAAQEGHNLNSIDTYSSPRFTEKEWILKPEIEIRKPSDKTSKELIAFLKRLAPILETSASSIYKTINTEGVYKYKIWYEKLEEIHSIESHESFIRKIN